MDLFQDYVFKSDSFSALPAPFQEALAGQYGRRDFRALLYSPEFRAGREHLPASALAITEDRWSVVSALGKDDVSLATAIFEETLLIELTLILLYGRLKLDYLHDGQAAAVNVFFNTVRERYYSTVVGWMLNSMEQEDFGAEKRIKEHLAVVQKWPFKFRNIAALNVPPGRQLKTGACWGTILGGFNRELAPASALVLTDAELIFIAEEKSTRWWSLRPEEHKYGEIITYLPLRHLDAFEIIEQHRYSILSLYVRAAGGTEQLDFPMANDQQDEVRKILSQVTKETPRSETRESRKPLEPQPEAP
jgi:hypothetical protein